MMKLFSFRIPLEILGQLLCAVLIGIAAFPSIVFINWIVKNGIFQTGVSGLFVFSISVGISYILFGLFLIVLIGLISRILFLKSVEGEISFYSWKVLPFSIYHGLINIADHLFLRLIRSTLTLSLFFKMMGLRVGKDTVINSTRISDCNLVKIGEKTIIGGDVVINAHSAEGEKLIRKRVEIGNNVTIGQYVTILPGVVIEDNVIVGANSVVPKNQVLKKGKVYSGVPVRERGSSVEKYFLNESETRDKKILVPEEIENDLPTIKNLDNAEILLKSYGFRHNEVLRIEQFMSQVTVTGLGLLVTVLLYSLLNNQPKLIALLPPIVGLIYAITVNLSTAMLKLAAYMYKVELIFSSSKVKGFDWEIKEGGLGFSRSFELDHILLNVIYFAAFFVGIFLTYKGELISPNETYLGYPMRDVVLFIDGFFIFWALFSVLFFLIKRKTFLNNLKIYRLKLNEITDKSLESIIKRDNYI